MCVCLHFCCRYCQPATIKLRINAGVFQRQLLIAVVLISANAGQPRIGLQFSAV